MKYEKVKELKDKDFKRFFGFKKETFKTMCEVVSEVASRKTRGRNSVLSTELAKTTRTQIQSFAFCPSCPRCRFLSSSYADSSPAFGAAQDFSRSI